MEYLSSMYIDNEMDLAEKKVFVEKIRHDSAFYLLTVDLLALEQQLEKEWALPRPEAKKRWQPGPWQGLVRWLKPLGFATAGFAVALLMFAAVSQPPVRPLPTNRFVLFEPAVGRVDLAGSFTGWQRISMQRIGSSGYWELTLPVATGEHRFAYILDNDRRIADPTLPARETDDFGGENSILRVEEAI